jgi:carbon storage regulator
VASLPFGRFKWQPDATHRETNRTGHFRFRGFGPAVNDCRALAGSLFNQHWYSKDRSRGTTAGPATGETAMLVLSRHRDETIMIGDDIVITIVDIRGDKVRLGIQAPTHVPVHRQEVYEAIKREGSQRLVVEAAVR